MNDFLNELRFSINNQNTYASLFMGLCIPDICGRIEYGQLIKPGTRYKNWFDKYAINKFYGKLTADEMWLIRNAVLHQGEVMHSSIKRYNQIEFQPIRFRGPINHMCSDSPDGKITNLIINVKMLIDSLIVSCEDWMKVTTKDYSNIMAYSDGIVVRGLTAIR